LAVFLAQRHQPRHFRLGYGDLASAPIGEGDIGDLVVLAGTHARQLLAFPETGPSTNAGPESKAGRGGPNRPPHARALKSSSKAAIRPASDCSMIRRAQRAAERNSRRRMRCFTRGSEGEAMESSRMPRPIRSGAKLGSPAISPQTEM